jgi:O-antigen ligase
MNQLQKSVLIGLGILLILASSYYAVSRAAFLHIFLGAAGLILLGIIFSQLYLGIVFMLCMLPLGVYAVLPANLKDFTSLTSLFGLAALLFFILRNKRFLAGSRIMDKLLYLLAVCLFVTVIVGELLKPVSTGISYPFTYFQLVFMVWLCEQLFTKREQIEALMKFFIAANILAIVTSLPNFDLVTSSDDFSRLSGLQGNSNEFAVYLSVAIVMIVYFFMTGSKKGIRIFLALAATILVIPLILSGSRGAVLFVGPVIALQLWRFRRNNFVFALFFLTTIIMAIGLIGPYLPEAYIQRIVDIPQDILYRRDTVGLRYGLWQYGLELWSQKPIWGIGSGMFVYFSINSPILHGLKRLPLHNMYLTQLVENGIVGLIFFLLLIVKSAWNYSCAIRSAGRDSPVGTLAITWQSILLLFLLNGAKGDWNANKLLWGCFALSLAIVAIQGDSVKLTDALESGSVLSTSPGPIT